MKDPHGALSALWLKVGVIAVAAAAIGSPVLQAQQDIGLSPSEFSAGGDTTLRAAGYAFSIWGPIYAGLAAFALYQALPGRGASKAVSLALSPAIAAMGLIGAWIWLSAADRGWATVAVIVLALLAAMSATVLAQRGAAASRWDRVFVVWPFAALAGWLTVASAINLLTVMTKEGLIGAGQALPTALAGIAAAALVAAAFLRTTRLLIYALPVAWGLVAVFVAERGDNPVAAWAALAAAALVLLLAGLWLRGGRRRSTSARR